MAIALLFGVNDKGDVNSRSYLELRTGFIVVSILSGL